MVPETHGATFRNSRGSLYNRAYSVVREVQLLQVVSEEVEEGDEALTVRLRDAALEKEELRHLRTARRAAKLAQKQRLRDTFDTT